MTAVEWFAKQLPQIQQEGLRDIWEQAKEMEKEQITDAYYDGSQDLNYKIGSAEQYYNETFKSE
jgi:hypothetical protein